MMGAFRDIVAMKLQYKTWITAEETYLDRNVIVDLDVLENGYVSVKFYICSNRLKRNHVAFLKYDSRRIKFIKDAYDPSKRQRAASVCPYIDMYEHVLPSDDPNCKTIHQALQKGYGDDWIQPCLFIGFTCDPSEPLEIELELVTYPHKTLHKAAKFLFDGYCRILGYPTAPSQWTAKSRTGFVPFLFDTYAIPANITNVDYKIKRGKNVRVVCADINFNDSFLDIDLYYNVCGSYDTYNIYSCKPCFIDVRDALDSRLSVERCQHRLNTIRQELMEAAWSPRRIAKYIEQGIDICEL